MSDIYDEKAATLAQWTRDPRASGTWLAAALESIAQALRESAAEARKDEQSFWIAAMIDAGRALKFCAQWGGRSGRIPGNGPGTKTDHAKNAAKRLREFLFAAALRSTRTEEGVDRG